LLLVQDTIFRKVVKATELRYNTGESALLEKTTAETRLSGLRNKLVQVDAETSALYLQLNGLLNTNRSFIIDFGDTGSQAFTVDSATLSANPQLMLARQQVEIAAREKSIITKTALPEFKIGYFNQSLYGVPLNDAQTQFAGPTQRFQGIQLGLIFPLWFAPEVNRTRVAQKQIEINQLNYEAGLIALKSNYNSTLQQFSIARANLDYYRSTALPNAGFIQKQSQVAYDRGEIGYTEHLLNIQQVIAIREAYLEALSNYNQTGVYLEYLTAQ
jgi:cobalt-zinc-cadmium resistance protein CzcA